MSFAHHIPKDHVQVLPDPPLETQFEPWNGAHNFVRRYAVDSAIQEDPALKQLHQSLVANASVCSYCGVGCPYAVVRGKNGKKKLTPMSSLGLCVKGETSLLTGGDGIRDEKLQRRGLPTDRIRAPMIRAHDGQWREVSWDEALDRAAWLFLHVREWVGPDGIAIYGNGQKTVEAIWMASLYKLVFKIPTIGANSEHCLASAGAAHELNFGNEASFTWQEFAELAECDVAVLHGTNPIVTFPQAYKKLKKNKQAIKVVIDPIESDTVLDLQKTDSRTLHIRFEQGGDVLFNLAVARIIFENGWEDQDYLARVVDPKSLAAFRNLCFEDRCAPDVVACQIALEEDDPAELAASMHRYAALIAQPTTGGERPRPAFVSSMGINQSTGSYGFSTNLNLLLLTGNVGRRGAGSLRIAGQSNATSELMLGFNGRRLVFNLDTTNAAHRQELADILDLPVHNIPDHAGTPVARMADDDFLYCFIFLGTQFTRNMPRLGHWLRRLGRSFNIVIDSFLPEGALEYADVILPAMTYTERTGVIQRGDRTLQLQQRVTEPPTAAWADEQVLARLALAIAKRLRDPDTAVLNNLDAEVVAQAFGRYLDQNGQIDSARVFDHVVDTSRRLNVYNRLEDEHGEPISHAMLQERAGMGVQWQGNGRYQQTAIDGTVFPALRHDDVHLARMVCPPERFLKQLVERGDEKLRSLITGRGRPGRNYKQYVARYNSGIKTLPITPKRDDQTYWVEIHPDYAAQRELAQGDPVRVTSHHGTMIGCVSLNVHVPREFPFLDFVPGEANRLTDYLDADQFTNQSLIKRTPIRIELLSPLEKVLWKTPDAAAFLDAVAVLHDHFRLVYATDEDAACFARGEEGAADWLPLSQLRRPENEAQHARAVVVGAMATFLQGYAEGGVYRETAVSMLGNLDANTRRQFLTILLPLLKKLDYDSLMLPLLNDVVGTIPLQDAYGQVSYANLHDAHKSAVIEIKEEVVGVQLYMAIKHGLELLYGQGVPVPQDDIAIISGIRIPCAADVPSYFMGISPADLSAKRLVHTAQIGSYSIAVVDRRLNRAVKINTVTGILPRDKELLRLRKTVIMDKRNATRADHRRFFDRLTELIVNFVRLDEENFEITGPVPFPWHEYSTKMSFVPGGWRSFRDFLRRAEPSTDLVNGLVQLEIVNQTRDADLVQELLAEDGLQATGARKFKDTAQRGYLDLVTDNSLSLVEKVQHVIQQYVAPILDNDGGRVELLGIEPELGRVTVRFLGSCANCPASILSVETIVKPPLLNIPGVNEVVHRTQLRANDKRIIPISEISPQNQLYS